MPSIVIASVEGASRGGFELGPVVIVIGLTIASALALAWLINRLPGSNQNTGAGPFSSRRRRNSFERPPDDRPDRPSRGPSSGPSSGPFDT